MALDVNLKRSNSEEPEKKKKGRTENKEIKVKKEEDVKVKQEGVKEEPATTAGARKARSRARSDSVEVAGSSINASTDKHYWTQQSAKEIRNQLALLGVSKDLYVFKTKEENIETLIKAIKANQKISPAASEPKASEKPEHKVPYDNNDSKTYWTKKPLGHIKEQLQMRGVRFNNEDFKTEHYNDKGKVIKDKTESVKTKPGLKKEDLIEQILELVKQGKWNK